ncbi:nitrogen regulatory protein OTam [Aspergillus campestris IBT 28561]|uniref:Nitrogen regulatory protein OTam n=1 Tax=Aspergillus campestris (strain IBT 28561) TaxID=1392248 RepID=A0A2I1DDL3_ASPC2|nr:nitrogen regulatory protein OTam [Aspergillus campestris IBT 28561]PKY07977.1 nitrogen regulatory protein OTam [Aspergillus campestris IBT 28561]
MAAVITLQSSPTTGPATPFQSASDNQRLRSCLPHQPPGVSPSAPPSAAPSSPSSLPRLALPSNRDGPSCDACLRRKSRCAMNEMVNKCYSCDFHRQDCTFMLTLPRPATADLASKKRKLDPSSVSEGVPKRYHLTSPMKQSTAPSPKPTLRGPPRISPGFWDQSTQHIGLTTALEPALLDFVPLDHNQEGAVAASRVRRCGDDGIFMRVVDPPSTADGPPLASLDAVESLVAPHGATLVDKFFENIHPTFPILLEDAFRQSYRARRGLSPLLLAAVYVLALKFVNVGPASQSVRRPDAGRLESTALSLLVESLPRPSISTIQAGLLLMEKSTIATAALNSQLVTAGFELALHQDCSAWRMDTWEKGLRKRLAWALYMQDKWSALVHGRPSHIVAANWTVKDLVEQDFADAFPAEVPQPEDAPVAHGPLFFSHRVALTTILSDILDRFYTLQAIDEFQAAGPHRTRMILERAKPAQIRLKDWFGRLPPPLKMDSGSGELFETVTEESARNGALHLAYFAAEITLHRCIVRSLAPETTDAYLSHICRSAAKTRLISAMDFVNRLRPAHLRSFWPAASWTNFALIGSFGVLLRITAPTQEEAEFYRLRLCEYRWTLSVSQKDAEFVEFALESLDNAATLDPHVPDKPGIDELMTSAAKPTTTIQPRVTTGPEDSILELDPTQEMGHSSISGLASPATSISDESVQEVAPL